MNYYYLARSRWVFASSFLSKQRWRTSSSSASPEGKATTSSWCCFGRCPMFFLRGFETSSFTTMGDQLWRCAPISALPEDSNKRMHKSFVTDRDWVTGDWTFFNMCFCLMDQCMVYVPTLTIAINEMWVIQHSLILWDCVSNKLLESFYSTRDSKTPFLTLRDDQFTRCFLLLYIGDYTHIEITIIILIIISHTEGSRH